MKRSVISKTLLAILAGVLAAASAPGGAHGQIEVVGASITDLQEAMASGRATSADITRAYLARIQAYDQQGPKINAMIWMNSNAVAEAEALDAERARNGPRGLMHGIPVILKDNYDTYDMPTSAGTLALAGNIAPDDAFQVARLREAGAVIIGKANMHELASGITTIASLGGQTLNPYDLRRNPGGSSGGTGAAIAATFAAVGWGSDTCGSIRIPSAQNNLIGLRPTKGLSSIDGIIPLSATQDVGGPLARSARDLAIALDATVGADPADPATEILEGGDPPSFVDALDENALEGARIGILANLFGTGAEEAAAGRLVREALGKMVELGADTLTVEIPGYGDLISGSGVIGYEFKWDLIDYLAGSPNSPVDSIADMLELGLVHQALVPNMRRRVESESRDSEEYLAAIAKREPLREAVEATMDRYLVDALVFPTVRTKPAVIGEPQRGSSCSLSANTGLPAMSLPVGFTNDGLPIGMEMVGRMLADTRLVAMSYAFEQATDHRREPYTVPSLVDGRAPAAQTIRLAATSDAGEVRGEVSYNAMLNLLAYRFDVSGVAAEDVYAVVLRHEDEEGWLVAERLSGPGQTAAEGTVRLTAELRDRLEAGEVVLELFTRQQPFGAARQTLDLPEGR